MNYINSDTIIKNPMTNKEYGTLGTIIESGSNENGNYIKLSDGTLFMEGTQELLSGEYTMTALGSGLYYSNTFAIPLPTTSIESVKPSVSVRSSNFDWASREYGSTTNIQFAIISNVNNTARKITIQWSAIGRWK